MGRKPKIETSTPLTALALGRLDRPLRTWSVIVTVFGDLASEPGARLWLTTIVDILAPLGFDAGSVRTALSRLVADDWLERERSGRNTAYRLTARARAETSEVAQRIYRDVVPARAGELERSAGWTIAFITSNAAAAREKARAALTAGGAGQVSPTVFLWRGEGPGVARAVAADVLRLRLPMQNGGVDRRLAEQAWDLAALGQSYRAFNSMFAPVMKRLSSGSPAGLDAVALRVLLVHELRRIALRDPDLDPAMLGAAWPGVEARATAAAIWSAAARPANAWLADQST